MKEVGYIRGLRGSHWAGLQYKLSPRRIKTISQPGINTDSCQGLLIWEKRRKFMCAVLVSFTSSINHSLKVWCVSNHQHAWTVFDKRGNELQLCCRPGLCLLLQLCSQRTAGAICIQSLSLWQLLLQHERKGKKCKLPRSRFVFQAHYRWFSLSIAWQVITVRLLGSVFLPAAPLQ